MIRKALALPAALDPREQNDEHHPEEKKGPA
jgi:hypothetical protein